MQENIMTDQELITNFKRARIRMMGEYPFMSIIALKLDFIICRDHMGRQVKTAATDGKAIYMNPEYVTKIGAKAFYSLMLHEIGHVMLGHHLRRGERKPHTWNIAADHAVNIILKKSGRDIPEEWVMDMDYDGQSTERIYKTIYVEPPVGPVGPGKKPPPGTDEPEPGDFPVPGGEDPPEDSDVQEGGDTEGDEEGDEKGDGSGDGDEPTDDSQDGEGEQEAPGEVWDATNKDGDALDEKETQEAEKELARDIQRARMAERTAGTSDNASLNRAADRMINPQEDWETLLERWIAERGIPGMRSWSAFDRRALKAGMWLPHQITEGLDWLVIGFDISSSIDQRECNAFVAHMNTLREEYPVELITVVPFNHVIQQEQIMELEAGDDVPSAFNVGGGTRFAPVFHWIDRQDREPDGVIMFTDMGSSDYGDTPPYPVLWASSVPVYDYDRAPFGDIVEIELI